MTYRDAGPLQEVDVAVPVPLEGEVLVRVAVSGVNPADWKNQRRYGGAGAVVPNNDGAGTIEAVGPAVPQDRLGQRVWLWEAARQRCGGTAQEMVVVPDRHAVQLPAHVDLSTGACLGVPAVTAHRCLTVGEGGPARLRPGALSGRTVLVAGGAGAVGHAAIQLARWSGARVITTVSSPEKAALARAAGADHVVHYRDANAGQHIRAAAPEGVDLVVEVAPHQNVVLDLEVLAPHGTVSVYAGRAAEAFPLALGSTMTLNARWQFVSIFTMPEDAKQSAVASVAHALADGALPVGPQAGLPLHHFPLAELAAAYRAVEGGVVGKALVDIS